MAAPGLKHFDHDSKILRQAARNWQRRRSERERIKANLAAGRIAAVESTERINMNRRMQSEARMSRALREAKGVAERVRPALLAQFSQERVIGDRDFVGIEFLEMAMAVGRFVGRINIRSRPQATEGFGTGFMVSPRLMLTNNHVLPADDLAVHSEVEFDYQRDRRGRELPVVSYRLAPQDFFITHPGLDFSLVAVRLRPDTQLKSYTWMKLRPESGKALLGQPVNIIQHPRGQMKQIVLRSNKLVDNFDDFVHYETDTDPGSSGSPVLSDQWQVVALHHSGVPKTDDEGNYLDLDGGIWTPGIDDEDRLAWIANEGIRVSSILKFLQEREAEGAFDAAQQSLLRELFDEEPLDPMEAAIAALKPPDVAPPPAVAGGNGVTMTIPLHVTVTLGTPVVGGQQAGAAQGGAAQAGGAQAGGGQQGPANGRQAQAGGDGGDGADQPPAAGGKGDTAKPKKRSAQKPKMTPELKEKLVAARKELANRPDVLSVELGYVFRNGWITDERAIVVTRRPKAGVPKRREATYAALPKNVEGLPLEVVEPSIEDLIRHIRPGRATEEAFGRFALSQEITYVPPQETPPEAITGTMRVIAHLSPDAGWPQLEEFLKQTSKRLVIGVFDFGAPHVVKELATLKRKTSFEDLKLVMQRGESVGEGTKEDDLHDQEVVDELEEALGNRFDNAWVKIGSVNGWVASSYHIKVIVRDGTACWLSSGNLQSSNQPDANPLADDPPVRKWLNKFNREWHAIVANEDLAQVFEKYLLHDFDNNQEGIGFDELALPDVLVPAALFVPTPAEDAKPFQYFEPFDETREFTVQPLLTPDEESYHKVVLDLINNAESELLIQNQTFNAPKEGHDKLQELLEAVLARQEAGVTVKIIFRLLDRTKVRKNLEALQDLGFNMDNIRVQRNCHTKGMVVDKKKVLLGSQNWSNAGVSVNRDASLLFDDEPLAAYFREVFDHDWNSLARSDIGPATGEVELVSANVETPKGKVRLSWKDYMEMQ